MRKIGLYGGTFNPVHNGHLNLAFELMEKGGLDEVWWIPTSRSPLRAQASEASPEQRYQMVALAIAQIPQFRVLDSEIKQEPPAYTFDTVKDILQRCPDDSFYLLLGQDLLVNYMAWKEPLELASSIPFLIGGRKGQTLPPFPSEIQPFIDKGIVQTTLLEISGTQIRERFKKGLYSGHLIPAKVLDFICVNQ